MSEEDWEKKFFDLLSMFGLVLQSVGGSAEFSFESANVFDPHGLEIVQSFNNETGNFRFEVRSVGE